MEYTEETEGRMNPWHVFGLEDPKDKETQEGTGEGENKQDPANPAAAGEKKQEPADPDKQVEGSAGKEEEPGSEGQPADKQQQSREERAENARRRRQKEMDDAVAAARKDEREKANKRMEEFLAQAKIKDSKGQQISNMQQAEEWQKADKLDRFQRQLKAGTLTPEALQTFLESTPTFQAMQQKLNEAEQQNQETKAAEFEAQVQKELEEIQKLDPSIKSIPDILAMETAPAFQNGVARGMTYLESFKLANHEQILARQIAAAKTGANINKGGKDHLRHDQGRGTDVEMSAGTMRNYRKFFPHASDAEIRQMYAKVAKRS